MVIGKCGKCGSENKIMHAKGRIIPIAYSNVMLILTLST
jgi:hypothetical protein